MSNLDLLERFVQSRESTTIMGAFGYGSGVFKQNGNTPATIDLLFLVDDAQKFRERNMENNPKDYPFTARTILKGIDLNRIKKLTGVTYQYNIPFEGARFKYGVANYDHAIENLYSWKSFFIPGRFQKPMLSIRSTEELDEGIDYNRKAAVLVAIMTLEKENPSLRDLYIQICSLSYNGDIRMLFAENPNKIKNIVDSNYREFVVNYGFDNEFYHVASDGQLIIHHNHILSEMHRLPTSLFAYIHSNKYFSHISKGINKYLTSVNRKDSIAQPLTGILTVGPGASINYLKEKIKKRFK